MSDIELTGMLGGGFQGFVQGWRDAEDRKQKQIEMEAKAKAQRDATERQRFMDALELRSKGFQVPQSGDIYSMDPGQMKYDPQYLALKSREGRASAGYDPYGKRAMEAEKAMLDLEKAKRDAEFGNLGKDKQIQIERLSTAMGNKSAIKSDIDSALMQLEDASVSDDEKLLIGRELLKTLNSSQGADAIGAEEAKRLGSLLEFKILPRIGEPGNMFGRDLPMFVQQVRNNRDRLGKSLEESQAQIDQLYGRQAPAKTAGLVPAGMLRQKGLLQNAVESVVPQAAAAGNKVKVSNGKETYFIEPGDLKAAEKDGFKRVK